MSIGEIRRVLAAGGEAGKIVFSGVGKSADEMRQALEIGIHCFNVESVNELERASTGWQGRPASGHRSTCA